MAKKVDNKVDNAFDVDSDLDFKDFDFPDPFAKDDRKPGIKLATGALDGAKKTVRDTAFLKSTLRNILPDGFKQTIDLSDKLSGNMRSLYDESAREIKPAIKEFKKSAVKLIPPESKLLPKSVAAMLKRWSEERDESATLSKDAQRESMLSEQMADIFKSESDTTTRQRAEDEGARQLKEGIDMSRHRDLFGLANRTAMATERMEQFQSNVGIRYQKKSLELQYRQLFAMQDLLGQLREDGVKREAGLLQIAKNTALPDYVKITSKETLAQTTSKQLMNKVSEGLFGGRNDIVEKTLTGLRSRVIGSVKNAAAGASMGFRGADMASSMSGDMGPDMMTTAGQQLGGYGVGQAAARMASKAHSKLKGSWLDKKFGVFEKGQRLEDLHENLNGKLNDFKDDKSYQWQDGMKPMFMRALQGLLPNLSNDTSLNVAGEKNMGEPHSFTKRNDKSLNDVIPGYLARILREIQVFRTGDEAVELTEYDYNSSSFTSKSKLDSGLFKKIITPRGAERTQANLDQLLRQIDPDGKLTPEAKEALKRKLLSNSANQKQGSLANLAGDDAYQGLAAELKDQIVPVMQDFLNGLDPDKKLTFSRKHNSLSRDVSDSRAEIQQQIDLGRGDTLRGMGLLTSDGQRIDLNSILNQHLSASSLPSESERGAWDPSQPFMGPMRPAPKGFAGMGMFGRREASPDSPAPGDSGAGRSGLWDGISNAANATGKAAQGLLKTVNDSNVVPNALQAGGQALRGAGQAASALLQTPRPTANLPTVAQAMGALTGAGNAVKNAVRDIYVKGEVAPRLSAIKMALGHYRDTKSGKVIQTAKDITGAVEDELKNIVLQAPDLTNLVSFDAGWRVFENAAAHLSEFKPAAETLVGKLKVAPSAMLNNLAQTAVASMSEGMRDFAQDVYVSGDTTPRLYAAQMTEGAYTDKESGNPIRHQDDIQGEVVDKEGNTVVSGPELPELVRFNVTTQRFVALRKVGRGLKAVADALWHFQTKTAVNMVKFNFRMLGKAARGIIKVGSSLLGINKPAKDVFVGDEPVARLYGSRLKAGHYRLQATGQTIYHQNEITGPVVDEDDQVMIADDELENMKVYDSMLKIFNPIKLVGKALAGLAKVGMWAQRKGFAATKFMVNKLLGGAGKLVKKVGIFLAKAQDVYVRGQARPMLLGSVMKAGGYVSAQTQKPITNTQEIDGDILNEEGQVVLSEEDIGKGLLDAQGKPLRGGLIGNVLGKLNRMFSLRVSLKGTRVGSGATPQEKAALKEASTGTQTVVLLEEIKTIFANKFTDKKVAGDSDGDGDRDGSAQDKASKRQAKEAADKAAAAGGVTGKAAGVLGTKPKAEEKEDGIGVLDALDAASDAKDLLSGRGGKAEKAGKVASKGSKLGRAAKLGGKALGVAGAAYGAYSAYDNVKQGNYGEAALDAGLSVGGLAMTGALGAGSLATAGSAAMAIGGGLLAFVSSPVVLAAGALALAGYGLYKGVQYLNNRSLTMMQRIRYVQYGFVQDRPEYASKVLGLETYLNAFVKESDSAVTLDEKGLDIKAMVSPFGLDPKNEKHLALFFGWYQMRFKPVYLTHLTAIKAMKGKASIEAIGGLNDEEKVKYIEATRFSEGPYHYAQLPILDKDFNASNAEAVLTEVDAALKAYTASKGPLGAPGKAAAAAVAGGAALVTTDAKGVPVVKALDPNALNAGTAKLPSMSVTGVSAVSSETLAGGGRLNAVDAVRFKAYGLVELDADKVKSLQLLEREIVRSVRFDSNAVASWQGNPLPVLQGLAGSFGIAEALGKEANDWLVWFKSRFLPVYMGYLSAYKVYTGKEGAASGAGLLKPSQQLEVARILVGLSGVWGVADSPWPNYKLSSDSSATKPNVNLLEDVAKQAKLEEDKKTSSNQAASAAPTTAAAALKPPSQKVFDSKANSPDLVSSDAEGKPKPVGAGSQVDSSQAGSIAMAGGEIFDGRNAMGFIKMGDDVSFRGMNPSFMKNFYGMAEEYGTMTGKKIGVNDGFRTYDQQVAAKKKYGNRAAEPGTSLHEFGLAMDIDQKTLDEMDKLGLMKKYGFTRPVGGEPWHMEPAGIQGSPSAYKNRINEAIAAIDAGVGRGGGGLGTVPNAPLYTRNPELAKKLLALGTTPTVTAEAAKTPAAPLGAANGPAAPTTSVASAGGAATPSAALKPPGLQTVRFTSAEAANDGEAKPSPSAGSPSNIQAKTSSMPADPTVKIPNPTGSGYEGMKDMIVACARTVGCDPDIMLRTAAVESGFKSGAAAGTSSAKGLFQFTGGTWRWMLAKYGQKYGYSSETSPMDPKANALMAAHYIKETAKTLASKTKRSIGATETYIGHFMGAGGGGLFLNTLDKNPEAIAARVLPAAAAANQNIFYEKGGRARTVAEVYAHLDNTVRTKAKSFGMPDNAQEAVTARASTPSVESSGVPTAAPLAAGQPAPSNVIPVNFSPKAKPTVASNATDMRQSPLASAYGFKPMQAVVAEKPAGQGSQMNKELFTTTEGLLEKSLDVQTKMCGLLESMFGIMSKAAPSGAPAAPVEAPGPRSVAPFTAPNAPVSMKRRMT